MAKALIGHVGGIDLRLASDVRRLTLRVKELEAELAHVRADHVRLSELLPGHVADLADLATMPTDTSHPALSLDSEPVLA